MARLEALASPETADEARRLPSMNPVTLRAILGRPSAPTEWPDVYAGKIAVVTGAAGSIGPPLCAALRELGATIIASDLLPAPGMDRLDVRDARAVFWSIQARKHDVVFHLAGAKHAPWGEDNPGDVATTNIDGTRNLLGAPLVTASTCKAADPETAYGASKLIAERMTLQAGGQVARFYNVPDTADNVFQAWQERSDPSLVPAARCWRYFISMAEAVSLLLAAGERAMANRPPARLTVWPGEPRFMPDIAAALYPDARLDFIPPRRGDRYREPLTAACESIAVGSPGEVVAIGNQHDPRPAAQPATVTA